jgi:hypothetical protein
MIAYDKTNPPRPGFDPSETVAQYIQKAATDGAQRHRTNQQCDQ